MADEKGIASLFIASGIVITVDEAQRLSLSANRYYALVGGFFLIALIGSFEPGFARMLAWLFFIGILLQRGPRVLKAVAARAKGVNVER